LLQVNALARTVERDFALFTAALGTDASVNRGAEALFFSGLTDDTTHC